jgi:hypothetical protein
VIELIRVSTEGQAADDRASIPSQRAVNRRTCAQYSLEIVSSIEISDVSGACVLFAPEIQRLIERMRDGFAQLLSATQRYRQLCGIVGLTPRGLHLSMRNPIWMGWRVIDKKRDSSSSGRYAKQGGRQADRRKIARAPEDVIRVRVISDPVLSEEQFQAVQRLMDLKQKKHWRSRPNLEHRFTYNGFLTCAKCGELIYTALARRDYYACKGRRSKGLCTTKYMAREKLEAKLDLLFAEQLTDRGFLEQCLGELTRRTTGDSSAIRMQRLSLQLTKLREKRSRVLEAFLDGVISRDERDQRLVPIDRELLNGQTLLMQLTPAVGVSADSLSEAFSVLFEWKFWNREQKRSVLATLTPEIRVADFEVMSIGVSPAIFSNESTLTGTGS